MKFEVGDLCCVDIGTSYSEATRRDFNGLCEIVSIFGDTYCRAQCLNASIEHGRMHTWNTLSLTLITRPPK